VGRPRLGTRAGTPRHRARRGEGHELRAHILEAAEHLLVKGGSEEAVSIRAVAQRCGVTPPAIYLHFADKSELIFAVCQARFAEFDAVLEAAARGASDPVEELRARLRAYVTYGLDNPEHYRVLFMTGPRTKPDWVTDSDLVGMAEFGRLVANVERIRAAGLARTDDPFGTAIALWAAAHGITSLLLSMPNFPWPDVAEVVDQVGDLVTKGLLARD